jgi:hypothetical protein
MRGLRVGLCLALVASAAVLIPVLTVASSGEERAPAAGALAQLLPDLDIAAPSELDIESVVTNGKRHFLLGFQSEAGNIGAGPLIVIGHREGLSTPHMIADQYIQLRNGQETKQANVGYFTYVTDPTHEHWHLLPFMHYELRRASDFKKLVSDHKTGFCLGDRYNVNPKTVTPGEPSERVYNTNCGPRQTELLSIEEGISVGWGDNYEPWRDGQYLDVTGLAAGRYVLVHRVNQGRRLMESNYANDASSLLIRLTWPSGKSAEPAISVLKTCPQIARCRTR